MCIRSRHSRTRARTIAARIDFQCTTACPCAGAAGLTTAVLVVWFDFFFKYNHHICVYGCVLFEMRKALCSFLFSR